MTTRLRETIRLVLGSQGAWFACVLGAARGWPWVGVAATALWVAVWARTRERPSTELRFLAIVGVTGMVVDTGLVAAGAFGFPDQARLGGPSPLWMVALWVGFGTTLRNLAPLVARPWIAMAVGAIAGPIAYGGGVALGAAHFGADVWSSRALVGAAWAVALPTLVAVERRIR